MKLYFVRHGKTSIGTWKADLEGAKETRLCSNQLNKYVS